MEDKDFRDMSRELEFLMPEDSLRRFVREKKEDLKTKVFGRDIFNNNKLTFEPEMNIATPSDYRLGPGDAVYVDVWGASQKQYTSTVSPEGVINLEGFGPVQVSGLTVAQANARLRSTLGGAIRWFAGEIDGRPDQNDHCQRDGRGESSRNLHPFGILDSVPRSLRGRRNQ